MLVESLSNYKHELSKSLLGGKIKFWMRQEDTARLRMEDNFK